MESRVFKEKKRQFLATYRPLGRNEKFRNLIAHLQNIPEHIPKDHLLTLKNVEGVRGTKLFLQKNMIFRCLSTLVMKKKNPKPDHTSTLHS